MNAATTDWNWFFSSLAQSAAAIVGIFGAFIITKILNNQSTFSARRAEAQSLILEGKRISDDAKGRYFEWYNRNTTTHATERVEERLEEDPSLDADSLFESGGFSPFVPRESALKKIADAIAQRREREKKEREELSALLDAERARLDREGKFGYAAGVLTPQKFPRIPNVNVKLIEKLNEEREQIDIVFREASHHSRIVRNFLATIKNNPESSAAISYSLAMIGVLFLAGVLYPLSFLPMPVPGVPSLSASAFVTLVFSIRGSLLTLMTFIFGAVLIMFFFMNYRMKYSTEEIKGLREFLSIGSYSAYFAIFEENMRRDDKAEI